MSVAHRKKDSTTVHVQIVHISTTITKCCLFYNHLHEHTCSLYKLTPSLPPIPPLGTKKSLKLAELVSWIIQSKIHSVALSVVHMYTS